MPPNALHPKEQATNNAGRNDVKRRGVDDLCDLIATTAPWMRVRYAF